MPFLCYPYRTKTSLNRERIFKSFLLYNINHINAIILWTMKRIRWQSIFLFGWFLFHMLDGRILDRWVEGRSSIGVKLAICEAILSAVLIELVESVWIVATSLLVKADSSWKSAIKSTEVRPSNNARWSTKCAIFIGKIIQI